MKKIAIYGGTELSAPESWFVVSLTQALLSRGDVVIVTGGFLYWPDRASGAISTDFSVLQGAIKYCHESNKALEGCLETWLPDPYVETDPHKKGVVRFKEGKVKNLPGETAEARRFAMVKAVDVLITVKGKKHTAAVLEFAKKLNKPALPLAFTGGDSEVFWRREKNRVQGWFGLTKGFSAILEKKKMESWLPAEKEKTIKEITAAAGRAIRLETSNQKEYSHRLRTLGADGSVSAKGPAPLSATESDEVSGTRQSPKSLAFFLSYSHKDVALKDKLDEHLTALKRSGMVSLWQDKQIEAGDDWDKKIKKKLKDADVVLLLISPGFVASDYINRVEMKYALKKASSGRVKIIPIYLKQIFTEGMPFRKFQGFINPDKPIENFPYHKRNKAFFEVVKGISDQIKAWLAGP